MGFFDRFFKPKVSEAPTPTDARNSFILEVEAILRSGSLVAEVTRVEGIFAVDVRSKAGQIHRAFLDNYFAETREMSPEGRRDHLLKTLGTLGASELKEQPWEDTRELLLPVLRGVTFGSFAKADLPSGMAAAPQFVRSPYLPYLDRLVVIDRPTHMDFVSQVMLSNWNVTAEVLFATAMDRALQRLSNPRLEIYDDTHGPLWIVATDDTYESSRLLLPGWLASFRDKVDGKPIAIVPERGMLLVGGDGRPEMIERLIDLADKQFDASTRRLSCGLYTFDEEQNIVPFRSAQGALAKRVQLTHEKLAALEYEEQKAQLDATLSQDIFVSTYKVFESSDGKIVSTSSWTRTVPTLLPRTAYVSLVTLNKQETAAESITNVPFDAIADRLTPVPDYHPQRFQTGHFPDENELRALKSRFPR